MQIRMVSNKEGERTRQETNAKIQKLKELLRGATVTDLNFGRLFLNDMPLHGIVLEKEGKMFLVSVEAEPSYEGSVISWMEVMDVNSREVLTEKGE